MSPWITLLIAIIVIIAVVAVVVAAYKYKKEGLGAATDASNMLFGVIPAAPYIPPPARTY